jgi:hypothetical protein
VAARVKCSDCSTIERFNVAIQAEAALRAYLAGFLYDGLEYTGTLPI